MRNSIIIVAGGKGLRVGGELPKQFIPIGGLPILMHTINAFFACDSQIQIVLVLPLSHQQYWTQLCVEYQFTVPHAIATGGETRFHSVKNGLALADGDYIGVHDGARPFVDGDLIARAYRTAQRFGAVIPVVAATDSLRQVVETTPNKIEKSVIIDRSNIRMVQTPQVFAADLLRRAYQTSFVDTFTDDASVVEAMGESIHLIDGDTRNMKVTTPIDLKIAELLLSEK